MSRRPFRSFIFFYAIALHVLVFYVLWQHWSVATVPKRPF
jgi:hypothetical protein